MNLGDMIGWRTLQPWVLWAGWIGLMQAVSAAPTSLRDSGPGLAKRSFAEWRAACLKVPSNRALKGSLIPAGSLPLPRFRELGDLIAEFFDQCQTGELGQTNRWVGEMPTSQGFLNPDVAYFLAPEAPTSALIQGFLAGPRPAQSAVSVPFQPFAQKVEVPVGAEVFFHADYHGDVRSLLAELSWLNEKGYLQDFTVKRPDFYLVFFGDYADRGSFGIEVLYTLFRLKVANPNRVFLGRGNHEEISLAARYGFLSEGRIKYGAEFDVKKIVRAFDFLPVVTYVGSAGNFIQCNHGGLESGFDPRPLLEAPSERCFRFLGTLNQRQFFLAHPEWLARSDSASQDAMARMARDFRPEDPINPTTLGFMWNDFSLVADEPDFAVDPGRALVYGQRATQFVLNQTRTPAGVVQAVFRGHQQSQSLNPMMRRLLVSRGIFRHWQVGDSIAKMGADSRELATFLERSDERSIPPGSVWTFNIGPDSAYGQVCGYTFDSFGIMKTAPHFADWRLQVINVEVGM